MRALLISAALTLAATSACGDQSYTPIGEDQEDKLCTQSLVDLTSAGTLSLTVDEAGDARHSGELRVTSFDRTQMSVSTEDLVVSVPGGSIATVEVEDGFWDLFTSMVFTIDVRKAGSQDWEQVGLDTTAYDIFWFTKIELNGVRQLAALSTLTLCTAESIGSEALDLPFLNFSDDYELRVRALPFDGAGDLVGLYDYTINVNIK